MTNMTFNLDNDLYRRMKKHPEIKWTEILRQSLANYLNKIEQPEKMSMEELRAKFSPEQLAQIAAASSDEEDSFQEQIIASERKRAKHLHDLEYNQNGDDC
jgi:hypothetical protein